jgi:hypothetical protein
MILISGWWLHWYFWNLIHMFSIFSETIPVNSLKACYMSKDNFGFSWQTSFVETTEWGWIIRFKNLDYRPVSQLTLLFSSNWIYIFHNFSKTIRFSAVQNWRLFWRVTNFGRMQIDQGTYLHHVSQLTQFIQNYKIPLSVEG